jgi:RNA polymerase sigma-70 factor (ECF subfamily)
VPGALAHESAFCDAVQAHGPAVYRYVRSRLPAQHAEDVTADTFAAAWANRAKFASSDAGELQAWLIGIARMMVSVHHRREHRWARMRTDTARHVDDHATGADEDDVLARLEAGRLMDRAKLDELLRELPPHEREPLLLHVLHGHSYEQIATRLGVPLGTVRSRISRGRARLRRLLLLALMLLLLLIGIVAVIAGADRIHARFGDDPAGAANHARVLRSGSGSDLERRLRFEAPYLHTHMERTTIGSLQEMARAYDDGEAIMDELRLVLDGDLVMYAVPTTRGYLCYSHWIRDGRSAGATCARRFTDQQPIKFGITTERDRRIIDGVMSDEVSSIRLVFVDGSEQPVRLGTNAFAWIGPKIGPIALRLAMRDGSTRTFPIARSGVHHARSATPRRCSGARCDS